MWDEFFALFMVVALVVMIYAVIIFICTIKEVKREIAAQNQLLLDVLGVLGTGSVEYTDARPGGGESTVAGEPPPPGPST